MTPEANSRESARQALANRVPATAQFISGSWVDPTSGRTHDVHDPSTGEIVHQVAEGGSADVDRAVAAAEAVRDGDWARADPFERSRALRQIAAAIADHADELVLLESVDAGKPLGDARSDVEYAIECFDYFASLAVQIHGSTRHLAEGIAMVRREPVGTVGVITPFNYPLALSAVKIAAALAAGCTVVHKPSEHTPLSALALAGLTLETDLPAGAYNVVTGDGGATGGALGVTPRRREDRFYGLHRGRLDGRRGGSANREASDDGARREVRKHRLR